MAGRGARTDLHQLGPGAPLRRAGAPLAAPRPADRRTGLSPRALHAGGPRRRRPDRRGEAGVRPLSRPSIRGLTSRAVVRGLGTLGALGSLLLGGGLAQALPAPE